MPRPTDLVRRRLPKEDLERGTSLMEMIVGMGLMGVFLAIFTTSMLSVYRASNHTESVTVGSGQLNAAFLRLDKMIRYASAISTPSSSPTAGGNYYVEIQSTNSGSTVCTQLRLNTGTQVLSQRTWTVPTAGSATNISTFGALASSIQANGQPFVLTPYGDVDFEQLTFNFKSSMPGQNASSDSNVTFTALNSNASAQKARTDPTTPDSVCQEVGRP